MEEPTSRKQLITTLAVLLVIVLIVGGVVLSGKKTDATASSNTQAPTTTSSSNSSTSSSSSSKSYKDGSYSATGSYDSPGGNESITVSVTLKDGAVTDTSAKSGANDDTAQEYQDQFISGYKKLVVGKKVSSISLSHVSGSSLTSQGFNEALQQIKNKAQA